MLEVKSQAISHSIENLSRQTQSFMEDELNPVANLLAKSDDSRLSLEKAISLLEAIKLKLGR